MKTNTTQLVIGKNWLNRLFSTTLMIVVLLVVLSTATFAWYNVANIVAIDDIYFKASANDALGGDLCLSWHELALDEYVYELPVENVTKNNVLYPMIPKFEGIVGETTFDTFASTGKFNKASQKLADNGGWFINLDNKSNTTPYSLTEKDGENHEFYLTNKSEAEMLVKITYEITTDTYIAPGTNVPVEYDIVNKFRSAVFSTDAQSGDMKLRGLIAKDANKINYGTLQNNTSITENISTMEKTAEITLTIPALSYVKVRVIVWFDGVDMVDEDGEKNIRFNLFFDSPMIIVE